MSTSEACTFTGLFSWGDLEGWRKRWLQILRGSTNERISGNNLDR